jgi:hypothetical protein
MRALVVAEFITPDGVIQAPGGAEYVAVCLPAFSPDTVHRDPE